MCVVVTTGQRLYFIFWSPEAAPVRKRMLYSFSKEALVKKLESTFATTVEAYEPKDLCVLNSSSNRIALFLDKHYPEVRESKLLGGLWSKGGRIGAEGGAAGAAAGAAGGAAGGTAVGAALESEAIPAFPGEEN